MPKISDARKESRRQQILDAARRCFAREGFHATTTADIARESGVSQGTLYLYFATKDDVILALADDRRESEALVHAMAQSEQDPAEGLALLLEVYGRSLADPARDEARRVGVQGWAEALRNPTIRAGVTAGMAEVRTELVRLVERGRAAGRFRDDIDPDAVARTLIATFQGLTLQAAWGEPLDLGGIGRLLRAMIRGALFTEPSFADATQPRDRE